MKIYPKIAENPENFLQKMKIMEKRITLVDTQKKDYYNFRPDRLNHLNDCGVPLCCGHSSHYGMKFQKKLKSIHIAWIFLFTKYHEIANNISFSKTILLHKKNKKIDNMTEMDLRFTVSQIESFVISNDCLIQSVFKMDFQRNKTSLEYMNILDRKCACVFVSECE